MYGKNGNLPSPLMQDLDTLDALVKEGDIHETPYNVFIGHNLGHRVFTLSIPFRKFSDISAVANDREAGPVAQRPLDINHAKKLAIYTVKGLVAAAKMRRLVKQEGIPPCFDEILKLLGDQPYFSIQPLVCNIRDVSLVTNGANSIRGQRLETIHGETAAFRIFLSERHILWVIDGQHRRHAADMALSFLETVRQSGKYPGKGAILFPRKGQQVTEEEMVVWNEAWEAARSYATLTVEVHIGLDLEQERQLFHDLNRLGKKVDASLALQFDGSNPVTHFIKKAIAGDLQMQLSKTDPKDWSEDNGSIAFKDIVAINAIAFLNKSNISGATPAIIEPRESTVFELWNKISEIPAFGANRAKEKTVAAQTVVLKALAKITYDLNFNNRKPENSEELWGKFLEQIPEIDFSHNNPVWRYYEMSESERIATGISSLSTYLPPETGMNRDIGAFQNGFMRFGAKHNDIYPVIADMLRWLCKLPNRHS